jgi:hypothetical protein
MPPKLLNDEGDLYVLCPLAHVAEADCERFARAMGYPRVRGSHLLDRERFDFKGL